LGRTLRAEVHNGYNLGKRRLHYTDWGTMLQERLVGYSFRGFMGVVLAVGLAMITYFLFRIVSPPTFGPPSLIAKVAVLSYGVGAGIGGFLCWLRWGDTWPIFVRTLVLALLGGVGGAWAGFAYGRIVWGETLSHGGMRATMLGAAVVANVLPLLATIYWARRHRHTR
jgi:hypothetical protein